ncbi:MAG: hypothetical protein ACQETB_10330 [Halobacteriota archaeon]
MSDPTDLADADGPQAHDDPDDRTGYDDADDRTGYDDADDRTGYDADDRTGRDDARQRVRSRGVRRLTWKKRSSYRIDEYRELLETLLAHGYQFDTFRSEDPIDPLGVLVRHDVDLSPRRALSMAAVEAELGIQSTYCFLLSTPLYDVTATDTRTAIDRIADLGHEIALHFDTRYYWSDEPAEARLVDAVGSELETLSRLVDRDVTTVSFHIPPAWVLDRRFDTFTNTYAPAFFSSIGYVSDSSQKWTETPPFPDGVPETFQLLVHPGLWHPTPRPIEELLRAKRDRAIDAISEHVDAYTD